jgi:microsomal dipeptidase-like Zn-dependent dipeptidase
VKPTAAGAAALAACCLLAGALAAEGSGARGGEGAGGGGPAIRSETGLANRCVAIASRASGRFIVADELGFYRAAARSRGGATAFYLKPTRPGRYLLYDESGGLLAADETGGGPRRVAGLDALGPASEWRLWGVADRAFAIGAGEGGRLTVSGGGRLVLGGGRGGEGRRTFSFRPDGGCEPYPEARVGATGRPFSGTNPDGTVFGFADLHLHLAADLRAGGDIIAGKPFARFGITRALGEPADARKHGADGSDDVTGNLLREGVPFGTHDTHGWPTFAGWPVRDTLTHQQAYYVWLERAWMAGLRLVVAQAVEDEPICQVEPTRTHSCDETHTIRLQIQRLRGLERYVDAQAGGSGRGWFRLVYNPRQARRAIERGKLAVVIGVESSNPLGCEERGGEPGCTRADVDRGLDHLHRIGVRSLFPAHWVNNAFAGSALEGGARGVFINILNAFQTGAYFRAEPCPHPEEGEEVVTLEPFELQVLADFFPAASELAAQGMPSYPEGRLCNSRGLTRLGAYLIRQLIARHMLIEVDHLSERARERVLEIAKRNHYPLISSHNGTGGAWTPGQLRRLYALGGIAAATPDAAPQLADKIVGLRRYRSPRYAFGVPLGTDTGGFAGLPDPPDDVAEPLDYPFRSYDGRVRFVRERTGERVFDLNRDGVAHYGLFADLIGDMGQSPRGERALPLLFSSAEAYLEAWERAARHRSLTVR